MAEHWTGLAERIHKGDKVIYYLTKRPNPNDPRTTMVPGAFDVTSDAYYDDTRYWPDGVYPHRANLEPIVLAKRVEEMVPMKTLVEGIDTFENKEKWGGYLRHPMNEINEEDYYFIKENLQENQTQSSDVFRSQNLDKSHDCMEWALMQIGKHSGYSTWVAKQDRSRECKGQEVGEDSLENLPQLGFAEQVRRTVSNIDVLWLEGNMVDSAYEVEHTTNIQTGLTRMNDLIKSVPHVMIRLYIVAPDKRREKVKKVIKRPTFSHLRGKVKYLPYSVVTEKYEKAKRILRLGGTLTKDFLTSEAEDL